MLQQIVGCSYGNYSPDFKEFSKTPIHLLPQPILEKVFTHLNTSQSKQMICSVSKFWNMTAINEVRNSVLENEIKAIIWLTDHLSSEKYSSQIANLISLISPKKILNLNDIKKITTNALRNKISDILMTIERGDLHQLMHEYYWNDIQYPMLSTILKQVVFYQEMETIGWFIAHLPKVKYSGLIEQIVSCNFFNELLTMDEIKYLTKQLNDNLADHLAVLDEKDFSQLIDCYLSEQINQPIISSVLIQVAIQKVYYSIVWLMTHLPNEKYNQEIEYLESLTLQHSNLKVDAIKSFKFENEELIFSLLVKIDESDLAYMINCYITETTNQPTLVSLLERTVMLKENDFITWLISNMSQLKYGNQVDALISLYIDNKNWKNLNEMREIINSTSKSICNILKSIDFDDLSQLINLHKEKFSTRPIQSMLYLAQLYKEVDQVQKIEDKSEKATKLITIANQFAKFGLFKEKNDLLSHVAIISRQADDDLIHLIDTQLDEKNYQTAILLTARLLDVTRHLKLYQVNQLLLKLFSREDAVDKILEITHDEIDPLLLDQVKNELLLALFDD
jgi:hypothetical protein